MAEILNCARCGANIGNGGIDLCLVVSDLDPEVPGMIRNLRFCRENKCDRKVLTSANTAYWDEQRPAAADKSTSTRKTAKAKSTKRT